METISLSATETKQTRVLERDNFAKCRALYSHTDFTSSLKHIQELGFLLFYACCLNFYFNFSLVLNKTNKPTLNLQPQKMLHQSLACTKIAQ